jgi:hypothetical protein
MSSDTQTVEDDDSPPNKQKPSEINYPPSPSVSNVETEGSNIGSPRRIHITIEYYAKGSGIDPLEDTITFRIKNGTAKLYDADSSSRLKHLLAAIAAATNKVADHPSVDEVRTIEDRLEEQREFIQTCKDQEEEDEQEGNDTT